MNWLNEGSRIWLDQTSWATPALCGLDWRRQLSMIFLFISDVQLISRQNPIQYHRVIMWPEHIWGFLQCHLYSCGRLEPAILQSHDCTHSDTTYSKGLAQKKTFTNVFFTPDVDNEPRDSYPGHSLSDSQRAHTKSDGFWQISMKHKSMLSNTESFLNSKTKPF